VAFQQSNKLVEESDRCVLVWSACIADVISQIRAFNFHEHPVQEGSPSRHEQRIEPALDVKELSRDRGQVAGVDENATYDQQRLNGRSRMRKHTRAAGFINVGNVHFARSVAGELRAHNTTPRSNYGRFRDRRPRRLATMPVRLCVISHTAIITRIPWPVKIARFFGARSRDPK
jgi:hypothetical protein